MRYNFEWDPAKARSNREKHGVGFDEAATVLRDPRALSLYDGEHSSGEDRWVTLGIGSGGRLLLVCHTFREETADATTIRIFSGRKATSDEARAYGD
jgi:uncharacterized DUF497 family protein